MGSQLLEKGSMDAGRQVYRLLCWSPVHSVWIHVCNMQDGPLCRNILYITHHHLCRESSFIMIVIPDRLLLHSPVGHCSTHLPSCSNCPSGQKHPGAQRREKQRLERGLQVCRQTGPHSLYSIPLVHTTGASVVVVRVGGGTTRQYKKTV